MQTITVDAGAENGFRKGTLLKLLDEGKLKKSDLGQIRVDGENTSFEVRPQSVDAALKSFRGYKLNGRRVSARKHPGKI